MKYLPHRPIKSNFSVVRARQKENRQEEEEKGKKGSQEKFAEKTHKLLHGVRKIIFGANCFLTMQHGSHSSSKNIIVEKVIFGV